MKVMFHSLSVDILSCRLFDPERGTRADSWHSEITSRRPALNTEEWRRELTKFLKRQLERAKTEIKVNSWLEDSSMETKSSETKRESDMSPTQETIIRFWTT